LVVALVVGASVLHDDDESDSWQLKLAEGYMFGGAVEYAVRVCMFAPLE
jgi:hypothetical protein